MTNKVRKVQVGTIYHVDGTKEVVRPANGKKFDYTEIQLAVGGYIESLIPKDRKTASQMYANEEGLLKRLSPNPWTWQVVNERAYKLNGYGSGWRVLGDIFAITSEEVSGEGSKVA